MRTTPYLSFHAGDAAEAMRFYRDVLGGELSITTFSQGGAGEPDAPYADQVMHSELASDELKLFGNDWVPEFCGGRDGEFAIGDGVSLTLEGGPDDAERLREIYAKLSEGGTIFMPLSRQEWGDEFGSFRDRFGHGWNISISAQAS